MQWTLPLLLALWGLAGASAAGHAHSQEMGLATFQESAQVIVDASISYRSTASIVLQSTSVQEIRIPAGLEQEMREDGRVAAVVVTNQDRCVLGVGADRSCVMINVKRDPADAGITAIQESVRGAADAYIGRIGAALGIEPEFHSVFIHTDDESNRALETSGVVSGRGSISAVYTMPMEDTDAMYQKITALLIPREIRDGGGFYDVARGMASDGNAKATFSLIPLDAGSLLQIRLSVDRPIVDRDATEIRPLEFLGVDRIDRSGYFAGGFYPLNSIIQVVVLSPNGTAVAGVAGNTLPTREVDGEAVPTDVTGDGWVFDPSEGQRIQGKYIFGQRASVTGGELAITLAGAGEPPAGTPPAGNGGGEGVQPYVVLGIIAAAAAAAAAFYLRGYRAGQ